VSRTLFSYQNLSSTAGEFSRKREMLKCENSTLATICPLLLTNGTDVAILWAGLAKRSKEISCSLNLVAAHDFYEARRTFYASSYENRIEKSVRDASVTKAGRKGFQDSGDHYAEKSFTGTKESNYMPQNISTAQHNNFHPHSLACI